METRLRQRVIGGIVLAALAVIFLPMFFKGSASDHLASSQPQTNISEQIPPPPPAPNGSATTVVEMTDVGTAPAATNKHSLDQQAAADQSAKTNRTAEINPDTAPVAKHATVYDQANAQSPIAATSNSTTNTATNESEPEVASSAAKRVIDTEKSSAVAQPEFDQTDTSSTTQRKAAKEQIEQQQSNASAANAVQDEISLNSNSDRQSADNKMAKNDENVEVNSENKTNSVTHKQGKARPAVKPKHNYAVSNQDIATNLQREVKDETSANKSVTELALSATEEDVISKNMNSAEEKVLSGKKGFQHPTETDSKKAIIVKPTIHEVEQKTKAIIGAAWVVQLGCFSDTVNAKSLADKLQANGFSAYLQKVKTAKGEDMTRVLIGPETQRAKAELVLSQLDQKLQLKGVIVPFDHQQIKTIK